MTTPPSTREAAPPDPAVAAVGRALDRAVRRVDALEAVVRGFAEHLASGRPAASTPAALSGGQAEEDSEVRSWLLTDDVDQAADDLADLVVWLDRVYLRFDRAVLSTCWLWHPDVVEELWWLRCAHADAYDPERGSWLRVGDWHDRQRPGVVNRVRAVLGKCSLSRHAPRNGRPVEVTERLRAPMATHARSIALSWAGDGVASPIPSEEVLAEAAVLETEMYRR